MGPVLAFNSLLELFLLPLFSFSALPQFSRLMPAPSLHPPSLNLANTLSFISGITYLIWGRSRFLPSLTSYLPLVLSQALDKFCINRQWFTAKHSTRTTRATWKARVRWFRVVQVIQSGWLPWWGWGGEVDGSSCTICQPLYTDYLIRLLTPLWSGHSLFHRWGCRKLRGVS